MLIKGCHHSIKLQNSFNKNGIDSFKFEVIEEVENSFDLVKREQHYMDTMDTVKNGYNISLTASMPMLGRKHSTESKNKISESGKGKIVSEETKLRMSKGQRSKVVSLAALVNMSKAQKGKKASMETRALLSRQRIGNTYGSGNKGSKCPEERKRKIAMSNRITKTMKNINWVQVA